MDFKTVNQDQNIDKSQKDSLQKTGDDGNQNTGKQTSRVFIVLNPVAGLTDADSAKQTIIEYCEAQGWQYEIHETKKDEDIRKLVQDVVKKGSDMIIAAGGDGTVADVVSGLVNSNVPMGILPAGTGNNLARDLSIPLDLAGALAVLGDTHDIQTMDVMEVNKKDHYVLNVSVGISSVTMDKTKRKEKRRFGMFAYLYRAIGTLIHTDSHTYQVIVDQKPHRFNATEVMITNHKFMGLQPQLEGVVVEPDDGRLDMFIVRAKSLPGYLSILMRFFRPRSPEDEPNLRYIEVHESIQIKSDVPIPAQADGEVIGNTPIEVNLIPHSLRVIVPVPDKTDNK